MKPLSLIDLGEPVARYWPEFGAANKREILVRQVMSHTTALPALTTPVSWLDATDDRRMAELLARQRPIADPRATSSYHAVTYGWICGELVRRVDGRSIGEFFNDEIARPLELELWIGLPPEQEQRVSRVQLDRRWGSSPAFNGDILQRDFLLRSVMANPVRYQPGTGFPWNEPSWHIAEVAGANAIGTARAIAKLYASLDRLMPAGLLKRATQPLAQRYDPLLAKTMAFGVGFQLQTEEFPFGPPPEAFGHGGSGGSCHGCWPSSDIGFSYAMNLMRDDGDDTRARKLLDALHVCLLEAGDAPCVLDPKVSITD